VICNSNEMLLFPVLKVGVVEQYQLGQPWIQKINSHFTDILQVRRTNTSDVKPSSLQKSVNFWDLKFREPQVLFANKSRLISK